MPRAFIDEVDHRSATVPQRTNGGPADAGARLLGGVPYSVDCGGVESEKRSTLKLFAFATWCNASS